MPGTEQEHLPIAEEKLRCFLALAEEILSLRGAI